MGGGRVAQGDVVGAGDAGVESDGLVGAAGMLSCREGVSGAGDAGLIGKLSIDEADSAVRNAEEGDDCDTGVGLWVTGAAGSCFVTVGDMW